MNLRADYFVGKQGTSGWSGVYGYRPDPEVDKSNSELFSVIKIKTEATDTNLERIAKMLLDEFQQSFYSNKTELDNIQKIEIALNKVKTKLDILLSREDDLREKGVDIELAIALVSDNVLYCAVIGESKIFILRGDKFVEVSKALVDADMRGLAKTGSLKLKDEDRISLATSTASSSSELINKALESLNVKNLDKIKEDEGVAVLMFANEELEWNYEAPEENSEVVEYMSDIGGTTEIEPAENLDVVEPIQSNIPNREYNNFVEDDVDGEELSYEELEKEENLEDETEEEGIKKRILSLGASALNTSKKLVKNINKKVATIRSQDKLNNLDRLDYPQDEEEFDEVAPIRKPDKFANSDKTYIKILGSAVEVFSNILDHGQKFVKNELMGGTDRFDRAAQARRVSRNRKILFAVVLAGVIVIYFSLRDAEAKRILGEKTDNVKTEIVQLQNEYNQLSTQFEVVKNQDHSKKELVLGKLDAIASKAQTLKKEGMFTEDIEHLIAQTSEAKDIVLLVKSLNTNNLQTVSDIGRVHSSSNVQDLTLSNGSLFVSDFARNVVYKIGTQVGSDPIEFIKDVSSPEHLVTLSTGDVIVYDQNATSTISRFNPTSGEFARLPYLSKGVIGEVEEVSTYAGNDALYEIHQNHQQIFKRDRDGNNYYGGGSLYVTTNPPNWKTDPEFGRAIDISVPYEIYMLIEGAGLKRYLAGGDNTLNVDTYTNLSPVDFESIKNATSFDIKGRYLAIGDSKNKRVLVFEIQDNDQKNLNFIQQFVYKGSESILSDIKELAVDDQNNVIYALDGSRVIKLNL